VAKIHLEQLGRGDTEGFGLIAAPSMARNPIIPQSQLKRDARFLTATYGFAASKPGDEHQAWILRPDMGWEPLDDIYGKRSGNETKPPVSGRFAVEALLSLSGSRKSLTLRAGHLIMHSL